MNCVFRNGSMNADSRGRARARAGLTTLEFMACVVCLVGGVWLGAMYLGVDVRRVAYTALSESKLMDKVPPDWRPPAPKDKGMTREQVLATLHEELGSLRNQISSLRTGAPGQADSATNANPNSAAAIIPTKEKTLAYWARLNEIAIAEAGLQRDAEVAFNAGNASKVFAIKGRVSRFSANAVEAVPTEAVDEAALQFGRQLKLWYDRAGELYERAVRIWETPIGQQARTQLTEEWKRADEQHRNEARLINEKAAAVRGSMSRIYGVEFPEFDKQVQPPAPTDAASTGSTAKAG